MKRLIPIYTLCVLALGACDRSEPSDAAPATQPAPPTESHAGGRIDVPAPVRQNLGMTFARAEYRQVSRTLRAPGRFELLASARHEVRAPFGGRVELLIKQYAPVKAGQVVARISSPEWHRLQLELEEDAAEVSKARAELTIAEQTLVEGQGKAKLLADRVARLQEAEVRRTELESELAAARSAIPRLEAEVAARRAALEAAQHHLPLAEQAAASQLGITRERLLEEIDTPQGKRPYWQTLASVEVRAPDDGIVESIAISDGGRIDALGAILTTIDLSQLRFRAVALQSDISRLRDGQPATVVAPSDRGAGTAAPVSGTLRISPDADPNQRTIDLMVELSKLEPWCRPGVSALVEVPMSDASEELAIPVGAVIQDGLAKVFYRRDRKNPDVVIRTEADLGESDGRWVVVQSGIAEGDEVVLDGVYELKLASTQSGAPTGGHFHADGTWHADGTPEPGSKK